jgi:hypothetical protein
MSFRHQQLSKSRARRSLAPLVSHSDARKVLRAAAPVAVALLGSLWLAGCDTAANQEDRKVQADVTQAETALASGSDAGVIAARKALETAAADTTTAPLTQAYAKSSLAQVEQDSASKTMRQIDDDDITLHQLIWDISQLAGQIDKSRALASSYDKYDPKPAHDAIAAAIAAAQGGPALPNLEAVKQTISALEGQIAKQADDLKSLQVQRTQMLDEADQADKSSEISKGQQSVDDFKRAADLRKQAGDLMVRIDRNQAQTVPMQKDMEVAQGQQTVLDELIKQLQDQSQQLDAGWKSIQDAVASQAVLQKQIASGGPDATPAAPPAPPAPAAAPATTPSDATAGAAPAAGIALSTAGLSLNDKADALDKLVQQIARERSDALSELNNALQHYRDAAKSAQDFAGIVGPKISDLASSHPQRPDLTGWKTLQAVTHPALYQLKIALAKRQLAELYVAEINDDTLRSQLKDEVSKILGAANIDVPASLTVSDLEDDKKNAAASAATAYSDAETAFTNVTSGNAPDALKKAARVEHILTLYGQVQLARAMGDAATAQADLSTTISERDEVLRDGLQLPPLPPEITPPPAPPAGAPATAPAT